MDNMTEQYYDENGCTPDCPIRLLDEQSGIRKSGGMAGKRYEWKEDHGSVVQFGQQVGKLSGTCISDQGGASRYFAQFYPDAPEPLNQQKDTMRNQILQGDCLEILRTLDANSVDSCVVDPPYGLGEVKDIAGLLMAWMTDTDDKAYTGKSGFMNKEWDSGVPGPRYWKEVLRILKPGAHILAFAGTRTYDLLVIALRLAGFEIRDQIDWLYGSGFPKSMDVSKQIDKHLKAEREVVEITPAKNSMGRYQESSKEQGARKYTKGLSEQLNIEKYGGIPITAPATLEAERYAGFGTNLKPAHEPICLARKPLAESSIAANVLEWGVGAINIDASRVGTEQRINPGMTNFGVLHDDIWEPMSKQDNAKTVNGRWPANLLLSHSVWCVPNGVKKVRGTAPSGKPSRGKPTSPNGNTYSFPNNSQGIHYNDSEGMEQVEDWICTDDCPVRLLDEQSGHSVSKAGSRGRPFTSQGSHEGWKRPSHEHYTDGYSSISDQGGASRYFMRFAYIPKASRRERSCNGTVENTHCTVKPLSLISYLVRMITPPGGICLDCFGGSGTTALACIAEGVDYLIIEQEQTYIEIATARINHALAQEPKPEQRVESWSCSPECPIKMLDEQSGISKSPTGLIKGSKSSGGIMNRVEGTRYSDTGYGDEGGASRYFTQLAPDNEVA